MSQLLKSRPNNVGMLCAYAGDSKTKLATVSSSLDIPHSVCIDDVMPSICHTEPLTFVYSFLQMCNYEILHLESMSHLKMWVGCCEFSNISNYRPNVQTTCDQLAQRKPRKPPCFASVNGVNAYEAYVVFGCHCALSHRSIGIFFFLSSLGTSIHLSFKKDHPQDAVYWFINRLTHGSWSAMKNGYGVFTDLI